MCVAEIEIQMKPKAVADSSDPVAPGAKIEGILAVLDAMFPDPPIPLNHTNAYQLLVAVVLSAQTTDGAVNACTKTLFEKVKGPLDMARLGLEAIEQIIMSLGLYRNKAKFLFGAAQMLAEMPMYHSGERIPQTREELTALPGVGAKTASVVLSQIHGVPSLAVDTHVHRLALRWGLTKEKTDASKVQADLEKLIPRHLWSKTHLQMIYYGREHCTAKNHEPRECAICCMVVHDNASPRSPSAPRSPPAKNIILYSDRRAELLSSPGLTLQSPVKLPSPGLDVAPLGGFKRGREQRPEAPPRMESLGQSDRVRPTASSHTSGERLGLGLGAASSRTSRERRSKKAKGDTA